MYASTKELKEERADVARVSEVLGVGWGGEVMKSARERHREILSGSMFDTRLQTAIAQKQ